MGDKNNHNVDLSAGARTIKPNLSEGGDVKPIEHSTGPKRSLETGLPLGVDVAILWRGDMLTAQFFATPQRVTMGPEGTFVMPADVIGTDLQVLVEPQKGKGFGLRIDNAKAEGHLIVSGEVHNLADVRSGKVQGLKGPVVPLTAGTRAVMVFGEFTFIVSREPVPPPTKFSLWSAEMLPFLLSLLLSLSITIGPLAAAFNSPEYLRRAQLSYQERQSERISELLLIEVEEEPTPPKEEPEEKKKEPPKAPELKPTPKELERQKKLAEEKEVKEEEKKIDDQLDSVTDEEERAKVVKKLVVEKLDSATAEIDAALAEVNKQEIGTKLFQETDDNESDDTGTPDSDKGGTSVLADPTGKTQGALLMAGRKKTTLNNGEATKRRVAKGLEKNNKVGKNVKIGLKTRKQLVVRVGGGSGSKARGDLPRKVVQKYIRRKMGAIKACYQKGLQSNPGLQGKVAVKFLIAASGKVDVAKIKNSSLNSPGVESCILRNVKSWRFPRADGGGSTFVIYPFRFSSR
ncbi:MAG: hypothetical protein CMH53_02610 [Myxococcales bacterium]|nr:hypothetical protein [Myxococcales bacterium]